MRQAMQLREVGALKKRELRKERQGSTQHGGIRDPLWGRPAGPPPVGI